MQSVGSNDANSYLVTQESWVIFDILEDPSSRCPEVAGSSVYEYLIEISVKVLRKVRYLKEGGNLARYQLEVAIGRK